ncbi:MAG: hypothetical protein MUF54_18565 [Polyangiaceae bacterium]|nr:hypothetical protein [Polyangiaceae bacterium]
MRAQLFLHLRAQALQLGSAFALAGELRLQFGSRRFTVAQSRFELVGAPDFLGEFPNLHLEIGPRSLAVEQALFDFVGPLGAFGQRAKLGVEIGNGIGMNPRDVQRFLDAALLLVPRLHQRLQHFRRRLSTVLGLRPLRLELGGLRARRFG